MEQTVKRGELPTGESIDLAAREWAAQLANIIRLRFRGLSLSYPHVSPKRGDDTGNVRPLPADNANPAHHALALPAPPQESARSHLQSFERTYARVDA